MEPLGKRYPDTHCLLQRLSGGLITPFPSEPFPGVELGHRPYRPPFGWSTSA